MKLFDLIWICGNLSQVLARQKSMALCKILEHKYIKIEGYQDGKFQIRYNSTQK